MGAYEVAEIIGEITARSGSHPDHASYIISVGKLRRLIEYIGLSHSWECSDPKCGYCGDAASVTDEMVDKALTAWFSGNQNDDDTGLERSMRAALEAALGAK